MALYSIKGSLINEQESYIWGGLFEAISKLLKPIIDNGENKVLIFHYSNEENLPKGQLFWTTNFALDRKIISGSIGLFPNGGYKYVYIALATEDENGNICSSDNLTCSQNLTRAAGGYELSLTLSDENRPYVIRFPIVTKD